MKLPPLDEQEGRILREIARLHQDNIVVGEGSLLKERLELGDLDFGRLMRTMEELGAIRDPVHRESHEANVVVAGRYMAFKPTHKAVQIARELDKPCDLVGRIRRRFRSNPWTAWPIVIGAAIVGLLVIAKLLVEFLQLVGIL